LEEKNSKVQELLALIKKEDKLIDEHWKEKMRWGEQICEMERDRKQDIHFSLT
jgi:hypothetical protein